ncbi:hypothetical protein GPZ88_10180 (plasmid) [Streptococcus ruminicola]|uniref:Uncharacterized protein n=1 Tax=Streptococcus ruminicola TaxID=2686210 RepID=A0A6G8I2P1_9STRE|nr:MULTISPECIES: hypothetical protein [Streptococcus]QGX47385.1 hypothetical protein GPA00_09635 [Streptococcus equinus]QIM47433.1 hypothetical protein GPZ88_10180 [Streptococcus ruminicola]
MKRESLFQLFVNRKAASYSVVNQLNGNWLLRVFNQNQKVILKRTIVDRDICGVLNDLQKLSFTQEEAAQ